jgi:hypothetical protein
MVEFHLDDFALLVETIESTLEIYLLQTAILHFPPEVAVESVRLALR